MVVVTPNDRRKSVYNRCVIDIFVAFLCFHFSLVVFTGFIGFCLRTVFLFLLTMMTLYKYIFISFYHGEVGIFFCMI